MNDSSKHRKCYIRRKRCLNENAKLIQSTMRAISIAKGKQMSENELIEYSTRRAREIEASCWSPRLKISDKDYQDIARLKTQQLCQALIKQCQAENSNIKLNQQNNMPIQRSRSMNSPTPAFFNNINFQQSKINQKQKLLSANNNAIDYQMANQSGSVMGLSQTFSCNNPNPNLINSCYNYNPQEDENSKVSMETNQKLDNKKNRIPKKKIENSAEKNSNINFEMKSCSEPNTEDNQLSGNKINADINNSQISNQSNGFDPNDLFSLQTIQQNTNDYDDDLGIDWNSANNKSFQKFHYFDHD